MASCTMCTCAGQGRPARGGCLELVHGHVKAHAADVQGGTLPGLIQGHQRAQPAARGGGALTDLPADSREGRLLLPILDPGHDGEARIDAQRELLDTGADAPEAAPAKIYPGVCVKAVESPRLPLAQSEQVERWNTLSGESDAIASAGIRPDRLELEITESAVIDNTELSLASLTSIHAMGVRIAMDDFGTGYSSLVLLKRF